jgi:hypothetical protein
MSDFSDRPFVAGSLTGLRTFRIDKYGRLMASQIESVWTPGENVGRCFRNLLTPQPGSMSFVLQGMAASGLFATTAVKKKEEPVPPAGEHRAGLQHCSCGFYAYFDNGYNGYHQRGMIKGLIEGYGITTVGTRGFRSEKAQIKALIIPPKRASFTTDLVRTNYPDVPIYESRGKAFADHPLTPPLTPDATSDPEFWTRDAL